MTDQDLIDSTERVVGIHGMTVNDRLYVSGLWEEFERSMISDRRRARRILELLKVDAESIRKILQRSGQ